MDARGPLPRPSVVLDCEHVVVRRVDPLGKQLRELLAGPLLGRLSGYASDLDMAVGVPANGRRQPRLELFAAHRPQPHITPRRLPPEGDGPARGGRGHARGSFRRRVLRCRGPGAGDRTIRPGTTAATPAMAPGLASLACAGMMAG